MRLPPGAAALVPGLDVERARPLSGGDTGHTWRVPRRGGRDALVKQPPAGMAVLEAAGLAWLASGGLPAPAVLAGDGDLLALEWVDTTGPSTAAARQFGADLARAHAAGASAFGVPPAAVDAAHGWVGAVRVPFGSWPDWPSHYVRDRLQPTVAAARRAGGLTDPQGSAVAELGAALLADPALAGPPASAARIHGDLWAGNLLWQADRVLVVDPAAVGGHPETDLAMLHLFGAPYLDEIVAGYESTHPLGAGWRARIPLHQVFPLLVHAVMFGGHYGESAARAARAALATS